MKHTLIILLSFVLSVAAFAQQSTVNMEEVKTAVTGKYAKLLDRYNAFDTTLSNNEYRLLYYGAVFQKGYGAYPDMKEKEINEAINKRDFSKAAALADQMLKIYPTSLSLNFAKLMSIVSLGVADSISTQYTNRYANLIRTIISTGDGKTPKTGFKVIFVADEYELIYKYFGIKKHYTQTLEGICDAFEVEPSDKWTDKKIYFDATEILKKEAAEFKK